MSTSPASPPRSNPPGAAGVRRPLSGAGIFCIVVGALLALPSGACTGFAAVVLFFGGGSAGEAMSVMGMVLLFAGLPLVGGIALIVAGLKLRKPAA